MNRKLIGPEFVYVRHVLEGGSFLRMVFRLAYQLYILQDYFPLSTAAPKI